MNWTDEIPKRDGYYFWRNNPRCAESVVRVNGGKVFWVGCDGSDAKAMMSGQWLGPITPKLILNKVD